MKLLIPIVDTIHAADRRLMRVADFLGIQCQELATRPGSAVPEIESDSALVINPEVVRAWVPTASTAELAEMLKARCRRLFVHAVRPNPAHDALINALSDGHLTAVRSIQASQCGYAIASNAHDICAQYADLAFGPADPANDRIFLPSANPAARVLIAIDGAPFMAHLKTGATEIFFIGSEDVADLDAPAGTEWAVESFSRLLPHVMALRHFAGEQCWRPVSHHATIVVDDPLLRANYGFLNFEKLLAMAREHNFHTAIAFIPYNYRRSSSRIVRLFHENANRLSLCFHGNDHTGAEFAAQSRILLNTMLHVAERRIAAHTASTGLACDNVMVFPQGQFSVQAMETLRSRNFDAVVNTVTRPRGTDLQLTLGEMAQPAVLRYGGFPLFLRRSSQSMRAPEIAWNLLFGRALFIVEHHNVFENPQPLLDAVDRINTVAPGIHWSRLAAAVSNTLLRRIGRDGATHIRAFARAAHITNTSATSQRIAIEWPHPDAGSLVEKVTLNGSVQLEFETDSSAVRTVIDLDPGSAATPAIVYRASGEPLAHFGLRQSTRAFVRRRLSEVRDNYLSKNPRILAAAKAAQKKLLQK